MFKHLFKIFPLFPDSSKFKFFLIILLLTVCAGLEVIGIGSIIPFLGVLLDDNFSEKYAFLIPFLQFADLENKVQLATYFLFFFIFIYFLKSFVLISTYWIQSNFFMQLDVFLTTKLFKKYILSPYSEFLSVNSGEIMRNIGTANNLINQYLTPLLILITELLVCLAIISLLLYTTFKNGFFLIIFFGLNIYIIQFFMKKKIKNWAQARLNLSPKQIKVMQESIFGIKVIKIFGRENYFINNFEKIKKKTQLLGRNSTFLMLLPRIFIELISVIALSIIMILIISQNSNISDAISILAVFVVAAFRLLPSSNRLLNSINAIREGIPNTKLFIDEFNKQTLSQYPNNTDVINFNNTIHLKNVSFKYRNTEKFILENINFKIKSGSCIGFVGKSGAGKSTLIDLFIGLLPATSGFISVDNKVINPSSRAWQNHIGYVSQNIYLLNDSIKKNIAFGLNDDQISQELLDFSLEASQLSEFVNSLTNKDNTFVGEHGIRLSGGQRQRIALARALYINSPILVFDEATSSLDTKTELNIMSSIKKLKGKKTILIIAHRLSTLDYCDEIYEMKNSKLQKYNV